MQALKKKIIVCAAGNESENFNPESLNGYYYPATSENAITVGSVSSSNKIATTSNFGKLVDIYSFGVNVNSYNNEGTLVRFSGTSAASPMLPEKKRRCYTFQHRPTPMKADTDLHNHHQHSSTTKLTGVSLSTKR